MRSELSAASSRFFLFADVLADLFQLESDPGRGITAGPEIFAREVPLLAAQSGYGDGALPFQKSDHRGDRMLEGESQYTYAHDPASDGHPKSGTLSAGPARGRFLPSAGAFFRTTPCAVAWERTPHGICSPIQNELGSDKGLSWHPPLGWVLIKPPWRRMLLCSTVKPLRVSLVEPVAYPRDSY